MAYLYKMTVEEISGQIIRYTKAVSGGFYNPEGAAPSLYFNEGAAKINVDGSEKVTEGAGVLVVPYDGARTFPIRDDNGNVTETMTQAQIYNALKWLYIYEAEQRDIAEAERLAAALEAECIAGQE